jgi:hypothetical protein
LETLLLLTLLTLIALVIDVCAMPSFQRDRTGGAIENLALPYTIQIEVVTSTFVPRVHTLPTRHMNTTSDMV